MCFLCKRWGTKPIEDEIRLMAALQDAAEVLSSCEDRVLGNDKKDQQYAHTLIFIDRVSLKEPSFDAERDGEWELAYRGAK